MDETTFTDDLIDGKATIDDYDDYVDRWHASADDERSLAEYLGLTEEEYSIVFRNPELISDILIARQDSAPFSAEAY